MRGIIQLIPGDLTSLVVSDNLSIPPPTGRLVLIRVQCAAVNRMDLLQGEGDYPVPEGASPVIGVEVSGTVSTVGEDCEFGFKEGDPVMALLSGGGYAGICTYYLMTMMCCFDPILLYPIRVS